MKQLIISIALLAAAGVNSAQAAHGNDPRNVAYWDPQLAIYALGPYDIYIEWQNPDCGWPYWVSRVYMSWRIVGRTEGRDMFHDRRNCGWRSGQKFVIGHAGARNGEVISFNLQMWRGDGTDNPHFFLSRSIAFTMGQQHLLPNAERDRQFTVTAHAANKEICMSWRRPRYTYRGFRDYRIIRYRKDGPDQDGNYDWHNETTVLDDLERDLNRHRQADGTYRWCDQNVEHGLRYSYDLIVHYHDTGRGAFFKSTGEGLVANRPFFPDFRVRYIADDVNYVVWRNVYGLNGYRITRWWLWRSETAAGLNNESQRTAIRDRSGSTDASIYWHRDVHRDITDESQHGYNPKTWHYRIAFQLQGDRQISYDTSVESGPQFNLRAREARGYEPRDFPEFSSDIYINDIYNEGLLARLVLTWDLPTWMRNRGAARDEPQLENISLGIDLRDEGTHAFGGTPDLINPDPCRLSIRCRKTNWASQARWITSDGDLWAHYPASQATAEIVPSIDGDDIRLEPGRTYWFRLTAEVERSSFTDALQHTRRQLHSRPVSITIPNRTDLQTPRPRVIVRNEGIGVQVIFANQDFLRRDWEDSPGAQCDVHYGCGWRVGEIRVLNHGNVIHRNGRSRLFRYGEFRKYEYDEEVGYQVQYAAAGSAAWTDTFPARPNVFRVRPDPAWDPFVNAEDIGQNSVRVRWDPPAWSYPASGASPDEPFANAMWLQYDHDGDGRFNDLREVPPGPGDMVVNDLRPNTDYAFRLAIRFDNPDDRPLRPAHTIGRMYSHTPVRVRTLPGPQPPIMARDFNLTHAITQDGVALNWEYPALAEGESPLQNVFIARRTERGGSFVVLQRWTDTDTTAYTDTTVAADTFYEYRIGADAGPGSPPIGSPVLEVQTLARHNSILETRFVHGEGLYLGWRTDGFFQSARHRIWVDTLEHPNRRFELGRRQVHFTTDNRNHYLETSELPPGAVYRYWVESFSSPTDSSPLLSTAVRVTIPPPGVPAAHAGGHRTVAENDADDGRLTITLDGTGSTDPETAPDGDPEGRLFYRWTSNPPDIELTPPTDAHQPSFTVPNLEATRAYIFRLVVSDFLGNNSEEDLATITVTGDNDPPVITAATAAPARPTKNAPVTLSAAATDLDTAAEDLTFSWAQTGAAATDYPVELTNANTATARFTTPTELPTDTTFAFTVTVRDGANAVTRTVEVLVPANDPPIAVAGFSPQAVTEGEPVTLSAADSTDTEAHMPFAYAWTQADTDTARVELSAAGTVSPTFIAPELIADTTLNFELVVTDREGAVSAPVALAVPVTADDDPPTATAGAAALTVTEGETVSLTGMGTDPEGQELTYAWTQTAGPSVVLSPDASAQNPTFTAPNLVMNTEFTFSLTAHDGNARSPEATVTILIQADNDPPTATAGAAALTVAEGDMASLTGMGADPEGQELTYAWTQTVGPKVELSPNANDPNPTFTAPNLTTATDFSFALTTTDAGGMDSSPSTVTIRVTAEDDPPVIRLTIPNPTIVAEGATVILTVAATDADTPTLSYQWAQPLLTQAGVSNLPLIVPFRNAQTPAASFSAPQDLEQNIKVLFTVTVSDGTNEVMESVAVIVQFDNDAPTAQARTDRATAAEGATVTLNGSGSTDPDTGQTLNFAWTQTAGTTVSLSDATAVMPTFVVPQLPRSETMTFSLTVTDSEGLPSAAATVDIAITATDDPPVISAATATPASAGEGEPVTLSAAATDADTAAEDLTFSWAQTGSAAADYPVDLTAANTATANFTTPTDLPADITLEFQVTVRDESSAVMQTVAVTVEFNNDAPVIASAGAGAAAVSEGAAVTLTAVATDAETAAGDLAYEWTQIGAARTTHPVQLNNAATAAANFVAPAGLTADIALQFQVQASDGELATTATVDLVVQFENDAPVISAATATPASAGEGISVTLTATAADADLGGGSLSYMWTQIGASLTTHPVQINNANAAAANFVAPAGLTADATLQFQVQVSDGELATTATVDLVVQFENDAPVISAATATPASAGEGISVTLTATAADADLGGGSLSYMWTQIGASQTAHPVQINNAATAAANFVAPTVRTANAVLEFQVRVSDGTLTAEETVSVTIEFVNVPPDAPPAPVLSVLSDRMIRAEWNPPANTGGAPIDRYELQRARVQTDADGAPQPLTENDYADVALTGQGLHRRHTDNELDPERAYSYRVRAVTSAGPGDYSPAAMAATNPAAPAPEVTLEYAVEADHAVRLRWLHNLPGTQANFMWQRCVGADCDPANTAAAGHYSAAAAGAASTIVDPAARNFRGQTVRYQVVVMNDRSPPMTATSVPVAALVTTAPELRLAAPVSDTNAADIEVGGAKFAVAWRNAGGGDITGDITLRWGFFDASDNCPTRPDNTALDMDATVAFAAGRYTSAAIAAATLTATPKLCLSAQYEIAGAMTDANVVSLDFAGRGREAIPAQVTEVRVGAGNPPPVVPRERATHMNDALALPPSPDNCGVHDRPACATYVLIGDGVGEMVGTTAAPAAVTFKWSLESAAPRAMVGGDTITLPNLATRINLTPAPNTDGKHAVFTAPGLTHTVEGAPRTADSVLLMFRFSVTTSYDFGAAAEDLARQTDVRDVYIRLQANAHDTRAPDKSIMPKVLHNLERSIYNSIYNRIRKRQCGDGQWQNC